MTSCEADDYIRLRNSMTLMQPQAVSDQAIVDYLENQSNVIVERISKEELHHDVIQKGIKTLSEEQQKYTQDETYVTWNSEKRERHLYPQDGSSPQQSIINSYIIAKIFESL